MPARTNPSSFCAASASARAASRRSSTALARASAAATSAREGPSLPPLYCTASSRATAASCSCGSQQASTCGLCDKRADGLSDREGIDSLSTHLLQARVGLCVLREQRGQVRGRLALAGEARNHLVGVSDARRVLQARDKLLERGQPRAQVRRQRLPCTSLAGGGGPAAHPTPFPPPLARGGGGSV
jgi:hypothetical protein